MNEVMKANISGPNSGTNRKAEITVRRSRTFSKASLRNTVMTVRQKLAPVLRMRRPFAAGAHECFFQIARPGVHQDLFRRTAGDDSAVRNDDDLVAERRDLLHDVAGEQHAATLIAQAANQIAQRARGADVQTAGGFVENHV